METISMEVLRQRFDEYVFARPQRCKEYIEDFVLFCESYLEPGQQYDSIEMLLPRVSCDWLPTDPQNRKDFPDSVTFHEAHGDDLSGCDAWVCECKSSEFFPCNKAGQEVGPDKDWHALWCCQACETIYDKNGFELMDAGISQPITKEGK